MYRKTIYFVLAITAIATSGCSPAESPRDVKPVHIVLDCNITSVQEPVGEGFGSIGDINVDDSATLVIERMPYSDIQFAGIAANSEHKDKEMSCFSEMSFELTSSNKWVHDNGKLRAYECDYLAAREVSASEWEKKVDSNGYLFINDPDGVAPHSYWTDSEIKGYSMNTLRGLAKVRFDTLHSMTSISLNRYSGVLKGNILFPLAPISESSAVLFEGSCVKAIKQQQF